jgi:rsbT co-antagonist protein RsbR
MTIDDQNQTARILEQQRDEIASRWAEQQAAGTRGRISRLDLNALTRQFLDHLAHGLRSSADGDISGQAWQEARDILGDLSRDRARLGFTPTETASFIFSLKEPLFAVLTRELQDSPQVLVNELLGSARVLDALGLYTTEVTQRNRDDIIARQQQDLLELSTPVVQLWRGILALPLIGTLDSARTQVVMESLLQRIVETGSGIAIIDITGVPTVDTLVAQHLLKTVAAARLMGADCIISGIRPQTAQTIVHLGVNLSDVTTKATLADAFAVALQRSGLAIIRSTPASNTKQAG